MADFSLNILEKDMRFIEEGIIKSNEKKKKQYYMNSENKVPKKVKNLKYFLKKNRNLYF